MPTLRRRIIDIPKHDDDSMAGFAEPSSDTQIWPGRRGHCMKRGSKAPKKSAHTLQLSEGGIFAGHVDVSVSRSTLYGQRNLLEQSKQLAL